INVGQYAIVGSTGHEYVLPAQSLGPGEFLVVTEAQLGFRPADEERLTLLTPNRSMVVDGARVKNSLRGRYPDGTGRWLYPVTQPTVGTPGVANAFDFHDEIVINEIMYHAPPQLSTPATGGTYEMTMLLSIDETTMWRYNQSGADLGADWARTQHSTWQQGAALLSYETGGLPEPVRTTLNYPRDNNPYVVTYYFETEFEFNGNLADVEELQLRHVIDDGAVFYLNGEKAFSYNMPGTFHAGTSALATVGDGNYSSPETFPKEDLRVGTNVLSVEVHQAGSDSSDVTFGMELTTRTQVIPPTPAGSFQESPEQWIELYNRSEAAVDLSDWSFDEAVGYQFPPGTVIAPGGYLVVAWDVAAFAAKYPDVAVVGNFDRALGNADDRVLLVDAIGNPADEVHYYDAGRWPGYADGGGSTLELRDPDADNAAAEAWAASDETGRSTWQTYTYRGVATADGIGQDIWHEFVMGLLDSGELLLDDVSVVEDPDGAAIQLIQNGSFQADAIGAAPQKWRLIGNHGGHQRSVVVQDPVNPANRALKLVATGATEHEHNHAETTLSNGRRVTAGKEYEISYRAKWIAGSSQLNTRLYFNWLQATTLIDVPAHGGTPGEQNSQFEPNVGPTYRDFRHAPVVPAVGEPTSVTVEAEDPDGVAALAIYYSVNGGGFANRPMSARADGTYGGTIPGQARGAIVQFYVLASDTFGATSTYPAAGPDSRALYTVADGRERLGQRHNVRVLMTPADRNRLYVDTNRLSNHRMAATLIYDDQIVHYDVGVRLKGSPWGRTHDNSVSLNVKFGSDDRFLGVHDAVAISRRPKKEIVAKHLFNVAGGGLDSSYDDVVYAVTPRPQDDGVALLSMARHTDVYLDSQYANGNDGMLYNLELLYTPTTTVDGNPESLKRNYPYTHTNGQVDVQNLGNDKESYRWNFQIRNGRARDDYSLMIALGQALELSGAELDAATRELMDVDQWMRTLAMASLAGNDDFYTRIWNHNFQMFQRPEDNKMVALPWDLDRAFQLGTTSPLWGGGRIRKVITLPANERLFYGHVWDIIQNTYNTAYMAPWTSHYGSLTGENYGGILGYIGNRANYALGQLPAPVPFNITTNNGNPFTSNDIGVTLQGKGWINVREIRLAGSNDPLTVTWTGKDTWQLDVPLESGENVITLEAFDFDDSPISSDTITVTSSVPDRPLWESLRITEVNYEPVEPTTQEEALGFDDEEFFEFIELQ
ncbi:MAG: lamin tail domain-containing protein, partial [Candidatus Nealsonbacteria bacterium]|nr:lamin tail domain-containing protein [Candidatus Nealsonbacteria bacterium]